MAWVTPSYRTTGDLIEAADWNQDVVANTQFLYDRTPQRATLWHVASRVISGSSLSISMQTAHMFYHIARQNPAALNDEFEQSFYLKSGTYTFAVLGRTTGGAGMVTWYIDNVEVVTNQDWYSAVETDNVIKTATVTITGSGRHILRGKLTSKNASSSGYSLPLTKMWFYPSTPAAETVEY